MMKKRLMDRAHELRKELVGDYQAVMSMALKLAWVECRVKLQELPTEVLESLKQEIDAELKRRKKETQIQKVKVNFKDYLLENDEDAYYNGGWVKEIKAVDQTKSNGYCFEGNLVTREGLVEVEPGYFVICNISGSRKHQQKRYHFVKVNSKGEIRNELLEIITGKDWALQVRDEIAKLVN